MFRDIDINALNKELKDLEIKIRQQKLEYYEPTEIEMNKVYLDIVDFIKTNNRIIYGGQAMNTFIKQKNKDDVFYSDIDMADYEFYSPDPVKDLMNLCDILFKKGYSNVQGSSATHDGTYKVFVNFHPYCDISYISDTIFNKLPVISINELKYIHPYFSSVDTYRVYTDLIFSSYRLEKTIERSQLLFKHYPLTTKETNVEEKITDINEKILTFVRQKIIHDSKLIVIGKYAYNYYIKKAKLTDLATINDYEVISTKFNDDVKTILDILKERYAKHISYDKHYQFLEFTGKKYVFKYNNNPILTVYSHNNRCIVYRYSEPKKTNFGTFPLVFMHLLINYNYGLIHNVSNYKKYLIMVSNMNKAKNKYLKTHNKTILDETPFIHFTFKCMGDAIDQQRLRFLKIQEKKKLKKPLTFRYDPPGKEDRKVPDVVFPKETGVKMS
jgi:hypothetical protein